MITKIRTFKISLSLYLWLIICKKKYDKTYLKSNKRDAQKVIQSFQHYVSHGMRSYSSAKAIWGSSYTCFRVFGVLGELWETGLQCPNFSKLSNFVILTYGVLNFLSRMGSINSFGQAVQEILLNNYLKSNFENSEIRDFVPTFWNFIRGNLPKKITSFLNFKCKYLENCLWQKNNWAHFEILSLSTFIGWSGLVVWSC